MAQINKIPRCNRCQHEVSWDNDARDALKTKRPVTPDKKFIHECPKDGEGNIIVAVGFEQQAKENYDKYLATKAGNVAAAQPTSTSTETSSGNSTASVMNSDSIDLAIKSALAELLTKYQAVINSNEERMLVMEKQIDRMSVQVTKLHETVEDYVTYNPSARALTAFMNELIPHVNMQEFKSTNALTALEQEKKDPTLNE